MYEQHFGLKKRPFRAKTTGTDVFVGPQTAMTMAGIKKALVARDAIASVSGPVGSGKTTLVIKALDSMPGQQKLVRVGRMRLQNSDVLQLLLDELNVENQPSGTIQQFKLFRQRLKELEDGDTRLIIAVEDSPRLSVDMLAEIEALTAADSGVSEGANVILMGDEGLDGMLRDPRLSRLQQRIRQRLKTTPLCAAELRGYLRHCFRLAGGDFEQIFEPNAALLLHHLTGGIPRIANTVLESAMTAAADQGLDRVSSELLAQVGENEFGLSATGFEFTPVAAPVAPIVEPREAVPPAIEPVVDAVIEPVLKAVTEPVALPVVENLSNPTAKADEPVIVFADVPEPADLPELIQDTLPDLQILAPEFAGAEAVTPAAPQADDAKLEFETPEPAFEAPVLEIEIPEAALEAPVLDVETPEAALEAPVLDVETPEAAFEAPVLDVETPEPAFEVPVLDIETPAVASEAPIISAETIPAWDRDPTIAELRPDLEALEQAMAFTRTDDKDPQATRAAEPSDSSPKPMDSIPEITLDHAISQRIERTLIDEPGEVNLPQESESFQDETKPELPTLNIAANKPGKSDTEIQKIAEELSRATSLEDVDDRMAETLFGDEFSLAASQFMKKTVLPEPANEDLETIDKNAKTPSASDEPQVATAVSAVEDTVFANEMDVEVTLESGHQPSRGGMDLSASQRLKTVRALNADLHPSLREPEKPATNHVPPAATEAPESIEDQINISMTQTLKALKIQPPVSGHDAEDEDDQKGKSGFFSRFKRS